MVDGLRGLMIERLRCGGPKAPCMDAADMIERMDEDIARLQEDRDRLDFLQSRTKGYGKGWIARNSSTGRGCRLHESSRDGATPLVRDAIDAARGA